ncbi:hypothetical protein RchiOBHm_Chr4g0400281 [Rosa chinensis]|uniref:Uncharacterized protein n=1 Tax=Rosa chinensis TaxID=74649 RepID=A0A2P6QST5_ROSCH|nr:hypothetical protein RchiOBHm_Chr4g0400281 [Rosa chinensis]
MRFSHKMNKENLLASSRRTIPNDGFLVDGGVRCEDLDQGWFFGAGVGYGGVDRGSLGRQQ